MATVRVRRVTLGTGRSRQLSGRELGPKEFTRHSRRNRRNCRKSEGSMMNNEHAGAIWGNQPESEYGAYMVKDTRLRVC